MNVMEILKVALSNPNAEAWLRVIRQGETSQDPRAYYMVNGGSFIDDLSRHPWDGIPTTEGAKATGAYQFLGTTWAHCRLGLGLSDFGPKSQDLAALFLTHQRGALDDVLAGRIPAAMAKCAKEWVSLPPKDWAAVYAKYGGLLNETQPAAPIEERSEPLPAPQPERVMPSSLDSIAGLVSIINPAAGGVVGLAGKLLEMFSPNTVAKLDKQLGSKLTDVASESATLVDQAKVLTGKADGFDAVAAARADPTIIQKLEETTEQRMDALVKAADKGILYDQSKWTAENVGRQTVSSIAIAEHAAGLWDMTRMLVTSLLVMLWGIAWGLLGAIIWLAIKGDADKNPAMLTALIGLAGPIWTGAIVTTIVAIVAYRFDGSKQTSAQSTALINAAMKNSA